MTQFIGMTLAKYDSMLKDIETFFGQPGVDYPAMERKHVDVQNERREFIRFSSTKPGETYMSVKELQERCLQAEMTGDPKFRELRDKLHAAQQ
jgi:hypothetical protein